MRDDRLTEAVAAAAIGFGIVGGLAPRLLARALGFKADSDEFAYLMRIAAIEDLGAGINLLSARHRERKRLLAVAGGVDIACCLLAVRAGRSGGLTPRTATMMAVATCGVAVTAFLPVLRPKV